MAKEKPVDAPPIPPENWDNDQRYNPEGVDTSPGSAYDRKMKELNKIRAEMDKKSGKSL